MSDEQSSTTSQGRRANLGLAIGLGVVLVSIVIIQVTVGILGYMDYHKGGDPSSNPWLTSLSELSGALLIGVVLVGTFTPIVNWIGGKIGEH